MKAFRLNTFQTIVIGIVGAIIILIIITTIGMQYCKTHPSYFQDSQCFNLDYRCQIECANYYLNYTDFEEPCFCGCGKDYKVSFCSGFISERK